MSEQTTIYVYDKPHALDPDSVLGGWIADERAAVLSIDMHEGHLSTSPDCPCPAPRGRDIIQPINVFHRQMRNLGVPIIHVKSELRASQRDDVKGASPSAWRETFPLYVGSIPGIDQHALAGSPWSKLSTEVAPEDEIVNGKKRLSGFVATDLDFLLRQMGVRTVILDGIMTDCCILNTAFDASNLGYRVVVAKDLTRGTDDHLEQAALAIISLHVGVVTDSLQVIRARQPEV
jgi:nicotinamidase-related amidase